MKTAVYQVLIAIALITASSCNNKNTKSNMTDNPLLHEWNTPHQTPPFDKIKNEHYLPAFDEGIRQARSETDRITNSADAPTFENTVEALENKGELLTKISNVFFNLLSAETNDEMQKTALQIQPKLTEFHNDISLNEKLFERVKTVYDNRENIDLNTEQRTLLEKTYKNFSRNGANLKGSARDEYRRITEELGMLSLKYNNNVLAETNAYSLDITGEADLAGLPEDVVAQAAATAKSKGREGWTFTLHVPSYAPFLKSAENRSLRESIWKAYNSKGAHDNDTSNREIAKQIANLRMKLANLLGYKTYADYVLEERMAKNPENVADLLNKLFNAAKSTAQKDVAEIVNYAKSKGFTETFMPWDFSFYSEKLKDEKYSVSDELLRPYFKLENVIDGAFRLADTLYGLKFTENKAIPVFHSDVKTYEVNDEDGKLMAVLYLDFFPRESKRGGAWMTSFREEKIINGCEIRPLVSVTCNFTKPTETKPSLLTFDEVETFLHEFGHALHGILAKGTYESLTGTSVMRDFVELPSQFMENYCVEKQFLDLFAKHYETGELIPQHLIDKIIASKNYNEGYATLRQLSFGMLDMAYHSITSEITGDVEETERLAMEKTQLLPVIDNCLMSTAFTHIFSGGYAAGYYSYKWSEVLDADAFSVFRKNGIFDRNTAASFRQNILEKGGTEHPSILYRRFRKQEPSIDALLIRCGFVKQ
ncbi:MAG: M3 family metallopeptidase [Prevotellaceae bacterium]|jgi:peptidyl-dipeptidase Dcp|nr:M3 family metallopeptidase [Prevotellaceae bacterium]